MSASALENPGFCWKCQALLNTQYSKSLGIKETEETEETLGEPNKKCTREIRTHDPLEATASDGCLLCLHLLHALSLRERATLRRLTDETKDGASVPDIEYTEMIFLREGHPPGISLDVNPNWSIPELESGDEIGTLLQLFPEAGMNQ
jgi:hypothetical protein